MYYLKMFYLMIVGLFNHPAFNDKDDFIDWYWGRVVDPKYPAETVYDAFDLFKSNIAFKHTRGVISTWINKNFKFLGNCHHGYSTTFGKYGNFVYDSVHDVYSFFPDDGSFYEGTADWEDVKANIK